MLLRPKRLFRCILSIDFQYRLIKKIKQAGCWFFVNWMVLIMFFTVVECDLIRNASKNDTLFILNSNG